MLHHGASRLFSIHPNILAGVLVLVSWMTPDTALAQNAPTRYLDAGNQLGDNLQSLGRLYEKVTKDGLKSGGRLTVGEVSGVPVPVEVEIIRLTETFSARELRPTNSPTIQGGGTNISRDGSCVVGYQDQGTNTTYHAYRWLNGASSTPLDLGTLGSAALSSFATDTNQDCSVVVGYSEIAGAAVHAFRWVSPGPIQDLNASAGASGPSLALGVSSNGSVIVGGAQFPAGAFTRRGAFRWAGGAFTDLIPGITPSLATAVSADGTVVVGQVGTSTTSQAFRWKQGEQTVMIGPLGADATAAATGVSDNGKIVVGISNPAFLSYQDVVTGWNAGTAFRWVESGPNAGVKDLRQLLIASGTDLTGINLVSVTGISPDGQWIQGKATTAQTGVNETVAFIAQFCDENIVGGMAACSTTVAPFTLGVSPDQITVSAGQNGSTTITVTPEGGFAQPVNFSCSGLPVGATCAFNPATVTPAGGPIDTTLTISTNGGDVASVPTVPSSSLFASVLAPIALVPVGLLMGRKRHGSQLLGLVTGCLIVAAMVGLLSCNSSDSTPPPATNSGGGAPATGTPAGTSSVSVTATSGSSSTVVPVSLTVTR